MSPFAILGVSGLFCCFNSVFLWKIIVIANHVEPDQNMASDLGLHYLPMTLILVPGNNGLRVYPTLNELLYQGKQTRSHEFVKVAVKH